MLLYIILIIGSVKASTEHNITECINNLCIPEPPPSLEICINNTFYDSFCFYYCTKYNNNNTINEINILYQNNCSRYNDTIYNDTNIQ